MNAHPALFHLLDALWSSGRLNTATGQQRAGDDQPSRPAKYPLQAGKPRPLGQVSLGARTSEKIPRPASRSGGSRQGTLFPFWICGSRSVLYQKTSRTAYQDVGPAKKMRSEGSGGEGICCLRGRALRKGLEGWVGHDGKEPDSEVLGGAE